MFARENFSTQAVVAALEAPEDPSLAFVIHAGAGTSSTTSFTYSFMFSAAAAIKPRACAVFAFFATAGLIAFQGALPRYI